jgi:tRNA modification GTPase
LLRVANKIDLAPGEAGEGAIPLSARTGEGMDSLLEALLIRARSQIVTLEGAAITRARHRQELERAQSALMAFLHEPAAELELRAEDLRSATMALGRLTGRVDVEDILDKIFADFCIGK